MTNETQEDPPLKLEVGETYEDQRGSLVEMLAAREDEDYGLIFIGWEASTGDARTYAPNGDTHDAYYPLIRKHTPPPEVKSLWVVINAEGKSIMGYDAVNAASWAEGWDNAGNGPCDAQRIDLTYQGGRRDDLRDKEAGK